LLNCIQDDVDLSIAKQVKLGKTTQGSVLKFLCPVTGCKYGENGSKHFMSSKLLKQV